MPDKSANPQTLTLWIQKEAREAGFELCGVADAQRAPRADYVREWLSTGQGGSMAYLQRNFEKRVDPSKLLDGANSIIWVGLSYHPVPSPDPPDRAGLPKSNAEGSESAAALSRAQPAASDGQNPLGRVARYAWGQDYHLVLKEKLYPLAERLRLRTGPATRSKVCVDTTPLLEREFAALAGLGWVGKNTMVIHPQLGSYFFLGAIVTTARLARTEPMDDHCGSCTLCLDACPTAAFPAPYQMDARRCISYLTIERREPMDPSLAPAIGDWIFGCDICQEVCPFNRKAPPSREPAFVEGSLAKQLDAGEVERWSPEEYGERTRGRALSRATLDMFQRNAKIVQRNALPLENAPP